MIHFIEHIMPLLIIVEKLVLALLLCLGLAVAAIAAWRLWAHRKAKGDPHRWIRLLSQEMDSGMPALAISQKDKETVPGRVVHTGLSNFHLLPEALEKVFEVQESAEKRELDKGLAFLATVGSNAPFLGLTGTVIGILVAFQSLAAAHGKGGTEVMVAISHALAATAIGLVVAIPAVVLYNVFRSRSRTILDQAREVRGLILARALNKAYSGIGV
jgi:biopolymer transport protein ExbB/TolQ